MKNVLVVSVHPDDETLGCGGTILSHQLNGDRVFCLWVTNGNLDQESLLPELMKRYKFEGTYSLDFPEVVLDDISLSEIIPRISEVVTETEANILYIPNRSDPHSDHRRVFDACQACIKSFRYPSVEKVMMMEVQSETDFAPVLPESIFLSNVFVDITEVYEAKMKIVKLFKAELLPGPLTRSISSIEALSRYRGSQINVEHAESFMLLKEIVRRKV